jgi:tetratricopeptide (TPR) repeat protein
MPALTASLNFDGKTRPPLRMEVLTTAPPSVRSAASQVSIPGASSSNTLTVTGSGLQSGEWTPYGGTSGSEARAAGHLVAAGEVETAAAHFLAGAKEAAAVGAYVQAIHNAREAVQLIESLPGSPRRRRLKIASLSELGRVQWQAAGPTGSATKFTLADALTTLLAARQILEADDPADLRTTLVVLLASVYYDIGDRPSLERALDELTGASRMMIAAGDAVGAASLLNDQAAIYVRLGDPVRATHLLEESKRVFERLASSDPKAAMELAETNHLLARLPLHVPARPGREKEALDLGFRHARAAEAGYRRLGATRELTRVWESMGKLAMRSGLFEKATLSLMAALEVQRELGDLLGMARTTSTLADVLTEKGDYAGAVGLLAESINKNREKGSPIGLAFNRRSMESLARRMPEELHSLLSEARARLQEAEEVIGKADLAGDLIQSID